MRFDNSNIPFSHADRQRNVKLPERLTPELAELLGILIGDGCVYIRESPPNRRKYEISVYGDSTEDLDYHKNVTSNLFYKLFNIKPHIWKHNEDNCIKVYSGSKAIAKFLVKKVGFVSGDKIENGCAIPQYLLNTTNPKLISSIIRGIADTDFCLIFKRRKIVKYNKNHYHPLVLGTLGSEIIVEQLIRLLSKLGISSHIEYGTRKRNSKIFKDFRVTVVGKKNLEKWMSLIGFNNPKHYTKYLVWKKFGFCPPRTTLEQRRKILKGNLDIDSLCVGT